MGIDRKRIAVESILACAMLGLASCTVNPAWERPKDKDYVPAPTVTVGVAFNINDLVAELPSGALPITIQKTIVNTGNATVPAGYQITETVLGMNFLAVAGSAGYVPGDPATQTFFSCAQAGPSLGPGQSAVISFALGSPACPSIPPGLTELSCGVYREALVIDGPDVIQESDEFDNRDTHYFYVPSSILTININANKNPNGDPNAFVVGRTVKIVAFGLPVPPPAPPPVVTHAYTSSILPAGNPYTVNGRTPRISSVSGASCVLTPAMPALAPPPVTGTYTCTIPDPSFVGPICNSFLGNAQVFEERLNTKLTGISADGCIIRQKSLLTNIIFECRR